MFIHKHRARLIIYTTALLINNSLVLGMEVFEAAQNPYVPYRKGLLNDVYSGFAEAIMQKEEGDIVKAKITLFDSYACAQKRNVLHAIEPGYLKLVCNHVGLPAIATHHDAMVKTNQFSQTNELYDAINNRFLKGIEKYHTKNIKAAIPFLLESYSYAQDQEILDSLNPLLVETVRKHLASAQYAQKQYQSALAFTDNVIQKVDLYSLLGTQAYVEGNFALGQEYYKTRFALKKRMPRHINKFSKYTQLAKECAAIPASRYLALMYAQDALMEIDLNKRFAQKNCLPLEEVLNALKNETLLKNIKEKALILDKYYEIIFALNTSAKGIMKNVCSHYTNATDAAIMGLFNATMGEKIKSNTLKNITFDDAELTHFYNVEGSVAIPVMKKVISEKTLKQELKDLFHIIIGGYYYHNKNTNSAIYHFEQCSTYPDDLYLQALTIQMNKEKVTSILPFLHKTISCSSKKKKYIVAKEIITKVCGYNSSTPTEEILSMSQELLPEFAVLTNSTHGLEYIQALIGLNDLRKKTDLAIEQQQAVAQLTTYFDFFSLLQTNDQKGLDTFFSKKNTLVKGIRRTVLQAIRGNKKNDLQKIDLGSDAFKKFCDSDLLLLKIIEYIAQYPQERFKIKPVQCRYLLNGLAELEKEDYLEVALFLQTKIFETTPAQDMLTTLEPCIALLNQTQENTRTNAAKAIIIQTIIDKHKEYRDLLIQNKQYEKAYKFAHYLGQLNQLIPSQLICNVFSILETSIIEESPDTYRALLQSPDRLNTYNLIKKWADEKDPAACDCISFILYEHSNHFHLDSYDKLALARECLNYLSYSIKHDNRTNGSQQTKQSLYAQLACQFGIREQSIPLLDEAIAYGSSQALYEKANFLSRKKPSNPHDLPLVIKLLEQHAISNDDDTRRAQSISFLGKHYRTFKDLEHQKKAFDYLKTAADLGNYNAGHLLALFYIDGLENHQAPDPEKAFIYLQKTIDLKKKNSYEDTLYLRASMYYMKNQYKEAHEDLVHLLAFPGYNQSQKLFAYWLMGLVKLHLNKDINVSEDKDSVSHLRIAYEIAASHKLENPNSTFMKDFKLLNDEQTVHTIEKNIDHIIENNKTDNISLDFCTIMGSVLFEQCSEQPITNQHRQYAVRSLKFAAENGHVEATFSLMLTSEEEIDCCDKIYTLEKLLSNNQNLSETIQDTLTVLYPADVVSQGLLIERLHQKNNPVILEKYISHLYEYKKPIAADPIGYSLFSYKNTEELIQKCLNIPFIRECVESFMKNPIKSTPQEHFITIWWASLLTYSLDEKSLLKGAEYLEKSREWFPLLLQGHIAQNLGCIYYKLGWQKYKTKDLSLAVNYLKKGCLLENAHCNDLFHKITSEQSNLNTTLKQAETAITKEMNMIYEMQTKFGSNKHIADLICKATDTPENEVKLYGEVETLVKLISNKDYFITSKSPLMCFNYAADNYAKTENNINVQQAIQKAIATSVDANGLFIMKIVLQKLCTFIKSVIEKNNRQQMELLLKAIKQELIHHKVNIKAFEALYRDIYKINLAQNNIWKKVR